MVKPRYTNLKVHISDDQREKIRKALNDGTDVTIQFTAESILSKDPNHTIGFTISQMNKLAGALRNSKGTRIKLSKAQLAHNKTIEGGFIGSLIAGVASAILPSLASFIMDKISGKGIYLKEETV